MNDRAVSLLEQYEIEVTGTRKGRGAILCDTDKGTLIFKEYMGSPQHLRVQQRLLRTVEKRGLVETEQLLPTKEGELFVRDHDGVKYLLKTYREGRECNVRETEECLAAVRVLAKLHLSTQDGLLPEPELPRQVEQSPEPELPGQGEQSPEQKLPGQDVQLLESELPVPGIQSPEPMPEIPFNVAAEYEKRNRELRRIRKFLLGRSQKTWFEISLLGCFDRFMEMSREASEGWQSYAATARKHPREAYCHGDYQYHNVLTYQRNWYLINFERCILDDPVRDLHLLMRKLLEKSGWSVSLGERLLSEYERIRPLSAISRIDLYYRLAYPEKFWKIANFYYNSGKAWIPWKNLEKLEKLTAQEKEKKEFLDTVFRI